MNLLILILLSFFPAQTIFCSTLMAKIEQNALEGDCLILKQGQTIYALKISKNPTSFFIAKANDSLLKRTPYSSWIDWLENGAEGALETTKSNLDTIDTQFPEFYLVLTLPWDVVEHGSRRKVGPEPLSGEIDFRPEWNPKIVVNGATVDKCTSTAYNTYWPNDGSEASGKRLVAYFPISDKTVDWFPYWIEFPGLKGALFVIDSKKEPSSNKQRTFEEKIDSSLSHSPEISILNNSQSIAYTIQKKELSKNINRKTQSMHLFSTGFTQKEGLIYA